MSQSWNYEATIAEIEQIVTEIESGELDLADVFAQFETAVASLARCETFLKEFRTRADLQIEQLQDTASTNSVAVPASADDSEATSANLSNPESSNDSDIPF
ncbi:exodeoxyribonuclease VII small subunit [Leptolyngbya sp. FACHB-261]|uniref:exodeoxyribonuclease VII small subunit n=1 Tax=Leptolyngbya sp. FACHB-261 TaxID=2692806 RepID=UPI001684DA2A|nr:exodeoxyribonuclease VII small subunit [Leptolyngbya sp. FACHB-261]MBD2102931.1 exodeoxyribonuclease VII small subunit [Leptolyngbya sp. FACHB-261]